MTRTFTLCEIPDHMPGGREVRVDFSAPLPLGWAQAMDRACELRLRNSAWTWRQIAEVMSEYHGLHYSANTWARHIKARLGEAAMRPRGAVIGPGHPLYNPRKEPVPA